MDTLFTTGIALEDGEIYADEVAYVKENKKEIGVEIHSGRNRIVRRMFEHLGYTVQKLDRVYYAGLTKRILNAAHGASLRAKRLCDSKRDSTSNRPSDVTGRAPK